MADIPAYVHDHTLGAAKSYMPLFVAIVTWFILLVNRKWGMNLPVDDATVSLISGALASVFVYWVPNKPLVGQKKKQHHQHTK